MTFAQETKGSLIKLIEDKTRGDFEEGLVMICRGPLDLDVWVINKAVAGLGTKEIYLDDVILSRKNADLQAIKATFQKHHFKSLEAEVKDDLSGKVERLFTMALACQRAEDSVPVNPAMVTDDVRLLHQSLDGRVGTDEIEVCRIFTSRNDAQLKAIATEFERTHRNSLEKVIESEFSGHMEQALLFILQGATNKASRDARLIYNTMKGAGTKDEELALRLVRAHWVPGHIPAIKNAFQALYKKDIISMVKDETSGDFERLLVALLQG